MLVRRCILLIILASPGAAAAQRCDGAAAAQLGRDLLGKGNLVQALREADTAAKGCASAATQLALGDVLAELWLRDRAATAYRRAALVGSPEEKDVARRALEALKAAGATPKLDDLVREAALKPLAEADRAWQRVVAHAEAKKLPTTPFVWSGHSAPVEAVAWGGKIIATGSRDRTIKLWDGDTGRGLATLKGHSDRVASLAFSSDGKLLASGAADRGVRLWDIPSGRAVRTIAAAHQNVVSAVAFSPDGKRLATGGWDAQVKLWDVATGAAAATLSGHIDTITRLAWSRDGSRLLTVSRDGALRLWDPVTRAEVKSALPGRGVADAVFFADGSVVLAQSDGARRFDAAGKLLKRYSSHAATHVFVYEAGQVAIVGRELSIVDATRGGVLRTVAGVVGASVAVSPDMSRAAVANGTAFVRSFAGTGRFPLGSPAPPITALAWDGTTLSIAGAVSASWDLANPPARGRGHVPVVPDDVIARATGGRVARRDLRGAALTSDGSQLVTLAVSRSSSVARPEGELAVWPAAGGTARVTKRMSVDGGALAVSRAGLVAVGGREIAFYRLGSLQKLRALPRAEAPATALAFTPDGRLLASGHMDGTIAFWDVASGRRRGILVVGEDGRWVYAAEDGRVDGDGAFVSLSVAGVVTPPGITRARVPSLSPLSNRR